MDRVSKDNGQKACKSGSSVLQPLQMFVEKFQKKSKKEKIPLMSEEGYRRLFSEQYGLTERESEVFDRLILSEAGVQEIADGLYISRRNLQRHIASIYNKTGSKSGIGLFQCYMRFRLGKENL